MICHILYEDFNILDCHMFSMKFIYFRNKAFKIWPLKYLIIQMVRQGHRKVQRHEFNAIFS